MKRLLGRLATLVLVLVAVPVLAQDAKEGSGLDTEKSVSSPDSSAERILSFVSDVIVQRSGDLDVTETIRFNVTGAAITHGINRDFPTSYRNRYGQTSTVRFTVLSVQRDGASDTYQQSFQSNGVRVRIGKADVTIPPGEHIYVIHYRTSRQVIYRDTEDELYWNVTGSGWEFPIDSAEGRITLPIPMRFGSRFAYTGLQGSTAHDASVVNERPGYIAFRTTAPLPVHGGLTIAAAFPTNAIDLPTANRRLGWWLQDWAGTWAALLALGGVVGYYTYAWAVAGRGPRAGTVVPLFAPPGGVSAAGAHYIATMSHNNRSFTAAIVQLGVLGQLRIVKDGRDGWFSHSTTTLQRTTKDVSVPTAEADMLGKLFEGGNTLQLTQANSSVLQAARSALETPLTTQYADVYSANGSWVFRGWLLLIASLLTISLIAMAVRDPTPAADELAIPLVAALFFAGGIGLHRLSRRAAGAHCLLWTGIFVTFGLAVLLTGAAVIDALAGGATAVLVPLLLVPLCISASWWMYAPTVQGRKLIDQIAGFKMYLSIAEEDWLDRMNPPEKTPELFERYLPYAIALGVENHWAARFAGVLAAAAASNSTASTMLWYSGSGNIWSDPSGFAADVGGSLTSAISSASTSPSSSSGGSSGGGSSGGGGGGGGGSGW